MTAEIKDWLDSLELHQYFSTFIENGYREIQECVYLTERDLDDLEITLPGHRRRILSNLPNSKTRQSRNSIGPLRHSILSTTSSIYSNEFLPPPTGHGHRGSIPSVYLKMSGGSRNNSFCESGNEEFEQIYDIPPARTPKGHTPPPRLPDDVYVTPDPPPKNAPPLLPPKKKHSLEAIDVKLGISPRNDNSRNGAETHLTREINTSIDKLQAEEEIPTISPRGESPMMGALSLKRRPVPKPRPSVVQKRPVPAPRTRTSQASLKSPPHTNALTSLEQQSPTSESGTYEEVADHVVSKPSIDKVVNENTELKEVTDEPENVYEPVEVKDDHEHTVVKTMFFPEANSNIYEEPCDVHATVQPDTETVQSDNDEDNGVYELQSAVKRESSNHEIDNELPKQAPSDDIVEYEVEVDPKRTGTSNLLGVPPSDIGASNINTPIPNPITPDLIDLRTEAPAFERVVIGADAYELTKEQEENALNESLYADCKRKEVKATDYSERLSYEGVWHMNSGDPSAIRLPLNRCIISSSRSSDRESTVSFDEPPPSFTPPPLPPHYARPPPSPSLQALPTPPAPPTPVSTSTPSIDPIPAIPPRPPHNVKSRPPVASPVDIVPMELPDNGNDTNDSVDDITALKARAHLEDQLLHGAEQTGEAAESDTSLPLPRLESQTSQETELNSYSPTVFPPSLPRLPEKDGSSTDISPDVRRKAPLPPPKKENPFKDYLESSRGLYSLQGSYEEKEPLNCSGWESEDTLSDGGDFHEEDRNSVIDFPALNRQSSIPIVAVSKTRMVDRSGFLYKKSSGKSAGNPIKSSFRWQKRWVVFDSVDLRYFPSKESPISKRVIPGITIKNVDQDIRQGEAHPFRFNITTIDRVYTFATDDPNELSLWTSLIMQTVLESQTEDIADGGDMHHPDKEGFVKMEGAKGKRYVVVKKDKMCYYNTYNDFQAATPIHQIEMKLATVKEVPKNKQQLQLVTHYAAYGLIYDSAEESMAWKECFEEAIAEGLGDDSVLNQVYENQSNRLCADCGAPDPHWASVNLVITICKNCAGIHRNLTVQISKVRSLRMDFKIWSPSLIQLFKQLGNENANNFWEWNSTEDDRVDSDCDMPQRRKYIFDKYKRKKFCKFHPLKEDQTAINEALCKSVLYDDVTETNQLVHSGADVLYTSAKHNATPLSLAKRGNKTTQMEFLYQNGAEGSGNLPPNTPSQKASVFFKASAISYKGYLHKTGSNLKSDFLKRYVVLEHNILTYSENENSKTAKDSIEKPDMLSVTATTDDRFEFTFELSTTKNNGRVYLFAADNLAERQRWVNYIAKTITIVPEVLQEDLCNLDRGGLVFLRDGASSHYTKCWIHTKKSRLYLYSPDVTSFEDIDLRKIKKLKMLNSMDCACGDTLELGTAFVIDLKNRALYIQADLKKETEAWYKHITKAALEGGSTLVDQQLTSQDVPVIVDKCINYIEAHGLETEGIYRLNGQNSKVTKLLEDFNKDAQSVHLRAEMTSVLHDVCTALKRFFRNLGDPLLTEELHARWIATAMIADPQRKIPTYEDLLVLLPKVNYATLRRLILHLVKVTSHSDVNKMGSTNLASIFGPILITVDKPGNESPRGFGGTNQEIAVLKDLIDNQSRLFEVKTIDREKERVMAEAMQKIMDLQRQSTQPKQNETDDLLIPIYVHEKSDENVITMKVSRDTTALQVQQRVLSMRKDLANHNNLGLFEVICDGELQRPIHYLDRVQEISLKWSLWPQEFSKDNHLCLKDNFVYKQIEVVCDAHFSLFGELKFSDRKPGFKRYSFEFSQSKLSYTKEKANQQLGSWNVEDLTIYLGCQGARKSPNRHNFTFIHRSEDIVKNKESPFFGHSVCCHNEEELYRWIAAMLRAQHPQGLVPTAAEAAATKCTSSQLELDTLVPSGAGTKKDPSKHKSLFQKWKGITKR